jgi:molybdopterin-containing oxidoreductase family iron-sulfur binding subunit
VHDSEGLNVMVYNRCVGTRYCSNNCPYKVRRFNWFNNQDDVPELERMVYNPEVTVRARGVMEKCSFCVQRIKAQTIDAANEKEPLAPDAIVTACQQACPTQAIVFGDLGNEASEVRAWHQHDRSYAMLSELNVKPRLKYLAKIRNPKNGDGAGVGGHGGDGHGGGNGASGHGDDHSERTPIDEHLEGRG